MRKFKEEIFLGNRKHSEEKVKQLHERLADAIVLLSGLQQPDHPECEEHFKICQVQRINDEKELKDIIDDISTALGFVIKTTKTGEQNYD